MRTLCISSMLLMVAVRVSAQLCVPTTYQLEDYCPWLGRLDPTRNIIVPSTQIPASTPIYMYGMRRWTTWEPINSAFFPGNWDDGASIQTEIVFIGQTGDHWGHFGFSISGETVVLSQSADDRQFGSNLTVVFTEPALPDFFVEATDGRPFDEAFPSARWYYGKRQPISSIHDRYPNERLALMNQYYVFALELPAADSEATPSLFIFGVNAFDQNNVPIPEPGTYGLAAAATLMTLIDRRRFRAARLVATT